MGRKNVDETEQKIGPPTNQELRSSGCFLWWEELGLHAEWWNYGAGGDGCSELGATQSLTIGGRKMYGLIRTVRGLELGMAERQVRRRHRAAMRAPGSHSRWLLNPFVSHIGGTGWTSRIVAVIKNGRVHMFEGYVGGAGE